MKLQRILLCWLAVCAVLARVVEAFAPVQEVAFQCHTRATPLHQRHDQPTRQVSHPDGSFVSCFVKRTTTEEQEDVVTVVVAAATNDDENDNQVNALLDSGVAGPLLLLLASQFLLFIGVGAVIPSIPLYGKELGFSSAANGIVISAPAVALLLVSKFSGNFADLGRKPAMMGGMALIAVADLGTATANSLLTLLVARLALGAGRGVSEAGERGLLADLAKRIPAFRGRALATQQAVTAVGIAIGAPLGGVVVERYGPRAAFLCVTAAAIVALICYAFLPETVPQPELDKADRDSASIFASFKRPSWLSSTSSTTTASLKEQQTLDWADFWRQNKWRGLALCQSGTSFGFACKIASIPVLATQYLPGGAIGAGALLSAAGLSGLVGAPAGGWLTDRAGAKTTVILSGIASAISLLLVPLALQIESMPFSVTIQDDLVLEGPALAFSLLVIGWSVGVAAQGPGLTALAQEQAPTGLEATAMALPRAVGDGTYIIAPFLLGLAADNWSAGAECAVAGSAILLGVLALAALNDAED